MEVMPVLHMNGGAGDTSYASNSLVQRKVISMTRPIMEEAVTALYLNLAPHASTFSIADLGCSSGPNTLFAVSEVIKSFEDRKRDIGGDASPEYLVYLNDLPGNDFNALFRSFPRFKDPKNKLGSCFITSVPGSFYERLFPSKSLHFVHSSYSLQWLSKVPEGLECNKGNIYMASNSPQSVIEVYYWQFQDDFSLFLKHRAKVSGGRMVLTFLGRQSEDPSSAECCAIWQLLAMALNEMVSEGLIEEEKMDTFNIPQYTPSPTEVKAEVLKEGSFSIDRLEVSEVNWSGFEKSMENYNDQGRNDDRLAEGYSVARCMRAVAEPMLVSHFGEGIIEDVFRRYHHLIDDWMAKENIMFINVTVSLARVSALPVIIVDRLFPSSM